MIDFPLTLQVKFPVVDGIQPQSDKFATGVENNTTGDSKFGNCEEELPKKPVGRLSAVCWPTSFPQNIDYRLSVGRQTTDSRPTVGDVSVRCR